VASEEELRAIEARKAENRKKVTEKMNYVKAYLKSTYGAINDEWTIILDQLEDHLCFYYKAKDELAGTTILMPNGRKNPLMGIIKDETSTINALAQKLGISPWDSSKIKQTPEDDSDDFMDRLTGNSRKQYEMEFPE